MKNKKIKWVLAAFALQLLMLLAVIALVCGVARNGRPVVLELHGYDPYDALRGRYLRLNVPDTDLPLDPGSVKRFEGRSGSRSQVYVVLEQDNSGISRFSYATLDRPEDGSAYIRCPARELWTSGDSVQVRIEPRIGQYYLNEEQADALDGLVAWDTPVLMTMKIWNGMYVLDGIEVEGVDY